MLTGLQYYMRPTLLTTRGTCLSAPRAAASIRTYEASVEDVDDIVPLLFLHRHRR